MVSIYGVVVYELVLFRINQVNSLKSNVKKQFKCSVLAVVAIKVQVNCSQEHSQCFCSPSYESLNKCVVKSQTQPS